MSATVFDVHRANAAAFRRQIDRANQRLQRAGIPERFTYTRQTGTRHTDQGGTVQIVTFTLNRPALQFGGWTVISVHERTANGHMLSYATAGHALDVQGTPVADLHCDHCGTVRDRAQIFRIQHTQTGDIRQVGGTCLELFTGVRPAGLWALSFVPDLDEELDTDHAASAGWTTASSVVTATDTLLAALRATADTGYVSRAQSGRDRPATADVVRTMFPSLVAAPATAAEQQRVRDILVWVADLDVRDDRYLTSLQTVFTPGDDGETWILEKHLGIAVSAVTAYDRHLEREARVAARNRLNARKTAAFLAPVGTNLRTLGPIGAEVLSVRYAETDYGTRTHCTLIDVAGHVLYWRASSALHLDPGDTVTITGGTVKDTHISDYTGDHETVLTRVKLEVGARAA